MQMAFFSVVAQRRKTAVMLEKQAISRYYYKGIFCREEKMK